MKKLDVLLFTSAMLIAGAYADGYTPQFQAFEGTVGDTVADWDGNAVLAGGDSYNATAGVPGNQTNAAHTTVLAVEGSVSNATMFSSMVASTASQVDMMVKVVLPDDELALPSGESGVQIAVGIATNGILNAYFGATSPAFHPISTNVLTADTWVRVSFNFDYEHHRCQISLNGLPCVSANGYANSTDSSQPGSWYELATGSSKSRLSSMKVVGTTAIDDVYTSQKVDGPAIDVGDVTIAVTDPKGRSVDVKKTWLIEQGIDNAGGYAPDSSGMTVAEKYVADLDVNDNIKFELKDLQPSTTETSKMVFSFPGGTGADFEIVGCDTPSGSYTSVANQQLTRDSTGAKNTVSVDLSAISGNVKYFKVKASR